MKRVSLLVLGCVVGWTPTAFAQVSAFPGAEGYGRHAAGGRGGEVVFVTNLDDSGPGSLRAACTDRNREGGQIVPRTVVFRVGGVITLQSDIRIDDPYLTIAGQTAPGDGVLIRTESGRDLRIFSISGAHDLVFRYLRMRNGGSDHRGDAGDCVEIMGSGNHDIIFDHCSLSWATDENLTGWADDVTGVTVQWCIIAEGLARHSKGSLWGKNPGNVTFYMNLFASNEDRNPWYKRTVDDGVVGYFSLVNNVVYNWDWRAAYFGWYGDCPEYPEYDTHSAGTRVNAIGNFFKVGPSTGDAYQTQEFTLVENPNEDLRIYLEDNYGPHRVEASDDEWNMTIEHGQRCGSGDKTIPAPESYRSHQPFDEENFPPVFSAQQALALVLAGAGAVKPVRDAVDMRIVQEVRDGAGGIPESTPNLPEYSNGTPYPDEDQDGMDDDWETAHGLNPADGQDGRQDADGDGYTNLEEFLNETDPNRDDGNQPPTAAPTADPAVGQAPLTVHFIANAEDQDGQVVSYHWDFHDGATSDEQDPVHVFEGPGQYEAALTVTDDGDASATASVTVTVEGKCAEGTMDCNQDPADGCETDVTTDEQNCGDCGHACGSDAVCRDGRCELDCGAGMVEKDGKCVPEGSGSGDGCGCGVSTDGRSSRGGSGIPLPVWMLVAVLLIVKRRVGRMGNRE
ncbi:MAG: PKD domain-containing protein [Deltaproteobacteria bacterium]|nr:PKD domain-containing protein [Deltaproteobacteria bacterium]